MQQYIVFFMFFTKGLTIFKGADNLVSLVAVCSSLDDIIVEYWLFRLYQALAILELCKH